MAEQNVTMQTAISMQRGKLLINYTVTNQSKNTIHLANRIFRVLPQPAMNENLAYIFIGGDGVLHIQKDLPAIPEGMSPTDIIAPFTTPVRPGGQFAEIVEIDVPVRQYIEYAENSFDNGTDEPTTTARGVQFHVGYFVADPEAVERTETHFGQEVILFTNPPGKFASHHVLVSAPVDIAVPVIER